MRRYTTLRGGCVATYVIATCLCIQPVWAQGQSSASRAGGPDNRSAQDSRGVGLDEIIVTAQRREQNLQEVPIAVTAITASALENAGIDASDDLPQIVPSVQFTRSGPSGLFFVRGVGTTNAATGEEGANAVYVDNVYMPDLGQTVNRFNNIERVEVLKGPQGTLFGRNATGGLIHIITKDPPKSGTEVKAEIGYSTYQTVTGKLYYGTAVSDALRFDVALTGENQGEGWGTSLVDGKDIQKNDYWGARGKAILEPASNLKFTLSGDYFHNKDTTTLFYGIASESIQTGGYGPTSGHDSWADNDVGTDNKIWGASFIGELNFDFATLTSITAVRRNNTHSTIDFDATPIRQLAVGLHSKSKAFQQEIRLASATVSPLSWQVGAFYLNGSARGIQAQDGTLFSSLGVSAVNVDSTMKTRSIAVFGEVNYDITPTTHLTGGIRYTRDKRRFVGGKTTVLANGFELFQGQLDPKLKYGKFTYRASIRQDLTDDINAYASFNRGFKAGAYSLQAPADPPVRPQFINAYEIGLKSQLFDRRLRLNVAAYRYDITDYQIRSSAAASPGSSQLLNAAKVKVEGVDVEFEAKPVTNEPVWGLYSP